MAIAGSGHVDSLTVFGVASGVGTLDLAITGIFDLANSVAISFGQHLTLGPCGLRGGGGTGTLAIAGTIEMAPNLNPLRSVSARRENHITGDCLHQSKANFQAPIITALDLGPQALGSLDGVALGFIQNLGGKYHDLRTESIAASPLECGCQNRLVFFLHV
jgi:hypothetical protein